MFTSPDVTARLLLSQLDSMKETLSKFKVFTHQARRHIDEMFVTLDGQRGPWLGLFASSPAGPTTSPRKLFKALARADEMKPGGGAVGAAATGGGMTTRNQQPERGPRLATPREGPGTPRRKGKGMG